MVKKLVIKHFAVRHSNALFLCFWDYLPKCRKKWLGFNLYANGLKAYMFVKLKYKIKVLWLQSFCLFFIALVRTNILLLNLIHVLSPRCWHRMTIKCIKILYDNKISIYHSTAFPKQFTAFNSLFDFQGR